MRNITDFVPTSICHILGFVPETMHNCWAFVPHAHIFGTQTHVIVFAYCLLAQKCTSCTCQMMNFEAKCAPMYSANLKLPSHFKVCATVP